MILCMHTVYVYEIWIYNYLGNDFHLNDKSSSRIHKRTWYLLKAKVNSISYTKFTIMRIILTVHFNLKDILINPVLQTESCNDSHYFMKQSTISINQPIDAWITKEHQFKMHLKGFETEIKI